MALLGQLAFSGFSQSALLEKLAPDPALVSIAAAEAAATAFLLLLLSPLPVMVLDVDEADELLLKGGGKNR